MFDCSNDVLQFHNDVIRLKKPQRDNMRDRRDANRKRLRNGLKKGGNPEPEDFTSQGSYAMRTMVHDPDNDYDIDDGVYFLKEDLVGPRGAELTALQVRQMVRDAIDNNSFKTPPEVRTNCVRVHYDAGYHVDLPAYRLVTEVDYLGRPTQYAELASATWKRSDARDVTAWFDNENNRQSPDTTNGRQFRRIVRLLKKLARSRASWKKPILSGFGITMLVAECYRPDAQRDDKALYDTMKAIRDRLRWNLVVEHPVTPDETITSSHDDPGARYLRDRLRDTIDRLEPLFGSNCDREAALKAWDKAFATDFFFQRKEIAAAVRAGRATGLLEAAVAVGLAFPSRPIKPSKPLGFA